VKGDPLGEQAVTPHGYALLTHQLLQLAHGKVVLVLEGGYKYVFVARAGVQLVKGGVSASWGAVSCWGAALPSCGVLGVSVLGVSAWKRAGARGTGPGLVQCAGVP
jgi:hypothetical protein